MRGVSARNKVSSDESDDIFSSNKCKSSVNRQSKSRVTISINDVLNVFIDSTDPQDIIQLGELKSLKASSDPKAVLNKIENLLDQYNSTINRLCNQLKGHAQFLTRLVETPDLQSLFLISQQNGSLFLPETAAKLALEQASRTSQLLSCIGQFSGTDDTPIPRIDDQLFGALLSGGRLTRVKEFLFRGSASTSELSAMLWQEIAINGILRRLAERSGFGAFVSFPGHARGERRSANASLEQFGFDIESIRRQIKEELKQKNATKLLRMEEQLRAQVLAELRSGGSDAAEVSERKRANGEHKPKTEAKLRPQTEREFHNHSLSENNDRRENEIVLRKQLKKELKPKIEAKLRPLIEREVRNQLIRENNDRRENEFILRKQLKKELKPKIEAKLRPQIERECQRQLLKSMQFRVPNGEHQRQSASEHEASLRKAIRRELLPQLESELRQSLKSELKAELLRKHEPRLRASLSRELRPQLKLDLTPEIERELRPVIERELRAQIADEVTPKITKQVTSELTPKLRASLKEELIPKITKQVKAQNEALLRDEIAKELRPRIAAEIRDEVTKQAKDSLRKSIERELVPRLSKDLEPAVARRVEDRLRKSFEDKPRIDRETFGLLRKATGLEDEEFTRDGALGLCRRLANEAITVRRRAKCGSTPLDKVFESMSNQIKRLGKLLAKTKGLLSSQEEKVTETQKRLSELLSWCRRLHESISEDKWKYDEIIRLQNSIEELINGKL